MKKYISIILVLVMSVALISCSGGNSGSPGSNSEGTGSGNTQSSGSGSNTPAQSGGADAKGEVLVIKFSTASAAAPGSPRDLKYKLFMELVEKNSGGTMTVDFLAPGAVVATEREMTEAVQLGLIDIGTGSDLGIDGVVGGLGWAWLPYMFTTYEEADRYYNNGWIKDELTRIMGESGLIKIAGYETDFRVVGSATKPITTLSDFRGVKIRVAEVPELLRFYELAGALSVAIAASETLTALTQGTIDAVDNSAVNLYNSGVIPSMKYITVTNHMYCGGSFIANPTFWNNLTAEQQKIVQEAAVEAGALHFVEARKQTESLLYGAEKEDYNYEVLPVSDELDASLREIAMKVWEEFYDKYPSEIMDRVFADFGK